MKIKMKRSTQTRTNTNYYYFYLQRFSDALYGKYPWVTALGFSKIARSWLVDNVPQKNNSGYPVRLFTLFLDDASKATKENLLKLGNAICEQLNAMITYYPTKMKVDPTTFFWENAGDTWEEVIGTEDAWKEFNYQFHPGAPDFFEKHEEEIFMFFKHGNLTPMIGHYLGAPAYEILAEEEDELEAEDTTEQEAGHDATEFDELMDTKPAAAADPSQEMEKI